MFDFKVKPDNGDEFEVTATARDVLVWEKTTRGASFNGLLRELQMVHLYKLAHIAARRQGLFTGSLQDFETTCELNYTEPEGEPDPTLPAP